MGLLGTATAVSTSTASVTVGAAVAAGGTVVLTVAWSNDSAGIPTIVSVVDSRGNTYTLDSSAGTGNGTVSCAIFSAPVTTALQSGDTITVTISANRLRWVLQANDFADILTRDQVAANHTGGVATAMSTGVTPATTAADELVVAVFGFGRGGLADCTLDPGWSGTAYVTTAAGSADRAMQMAYKTVTATGTQEGTATLSVASAYSACIATYAITEPPPPPSLPSAPEVPVFLPGVPVGQVPSEFNAKIRDPFTALLAPACFRARNTAGQAITENTIQAVQWTAVDEDPYEGWASGAPTRFVVPDGWAGWWAVTANVSIFGTGASSLVLIPSIAVNSGLPNIGVIYEGQEVFVPTSTSGAPKTVNGAWWVYAKPGDVIEVTLYFSSESAITAVDTTAGFECRVELIWDGA